MRTTIRLDEQLLQEAKRAALDSGQTLTAVIEQALRGELARRRQASQREQVELVTFGGQGLQPGIDLDDASALLELMEGDDDPSRR